MQAYHLLAVTMSGSTIVLRVQDCENTIAFIASSFDDVAIPARSIELSSISLSVPKGREGVIMIEVTIKNGEGGYYQSFQACLPVRWRNDKLAVDLKSPFISDKGLCQLSAERDLFVHAGADKFVCPWECDDRPRSKDKRESLRSSGLMICLDGNLMCRFLMGEVSVEVLKAASGPCPRDAQKLELEDLRSKLAESEEHFRALDVVYKGKVEMISGLEAEIKRLKADVAQTTMSLTVLIRSVCGILKNEGVEKTLFGWVWPVKLEKILARVKHHAGLNSVELE